MKLAVDRLSSEGHAVAACAVLMPNPMPAWNLEQIRAVHIRWHQAEGVLFPDAIARAAEACGVNLVEVPEKSLGQCVDDAMGAAASAVTKRVDALARTLGPPWGKDQKTAALAAIVALRR